MTLTAVTAPPPAGAGSGGSAIDQDSGAIALCDKLMNKSSDCVKIIFEMLEGAHAYKMLHSLCHPKGEKPGLDPDLVQVIKEGYTHHDLSEAKITKDDFISYLNQFSNVQTLVIPENLRSEITDDDLKQIVENCPNLEHLDLTDCRKITNEGLAHLTALNKLIHLDLAYCTSIRNSGLAHLTALTQLTYLNLKNCFITNEGLAHLVARKEDDSLKLPNLTHLILADCVLITNIGVAHLAALTQLTHLNLKNCYLITDAGVADLATLIQLTYLNLKGCHLITDIGVAHLTAKNADDSLKLPNLTHLILADCRRITCIGFDYLKVLTQLVYLDLAGTWIGYASFLYDLIHLTYLNLNDCKNFMYAESKIYETRQEIIAMLKILMEANRLEANRLEANRLEARYRSGL